MNKKQIDISLMIISLILIVAVVILLAMFPTEATDFIGKMFSFITGNLGVPILWFGLFSP